MQYLHCNIFLHQDLSTLAYIGGNHRGFAPTNPLYILRYPGRIYRILERYQIWDYPTVYPYYGFSWQLSTIFNRQLGEILCKQGLSELSSWQISKRFKVLRISSGNGASKSSGRVNSPAQRAVMSKLLNAWRNWFNFSNRFPCLHDNNSLTSFDLVKVTCKIPLNFLDGNF